jgi:hypothetical protein
MTRGVSAASTGDRPESLPDHRTRATRCIITGLTRMAAPNEIGDPNPQLDMRRDPLLIQQRRIFSLSSDSERTCVFHLGNLDVAIRAEYTPCQGIGSDKPTRAVVSRSALGCPPIKARYRKPNRLQNNSRRHRTVPQGSEFISAATSETSHRHYRDA